MAQNPPNKPGPPFEEEKAPYQPFPVVPPGPLNGTPKDPNFATNK